MNAKVPALRARARGLSLSLSTLAALSLAACSASDRGTGRDADRASSVGARVDADAGAASPIRANDDDGGADAGCAQNVDIAFVMDVSTSMDAFLDKLAQEMAAVDTSIKALSPTANPYYGLAVFVDDAKLLNNGQPFANVASLKSEFQHWSSFSKGNTELDGNGQNTTWPENSIDAIYDAASGFAWRPGSLRIVIHTTDDTFWNGPATENGVAIQHSYQETVAKLQSQQIRFFTFAAKLGGPSKTDDVKMGWFTPYQGQDPIPKATFGGAFELEQIKGNQVSLSSSIEGLVKDTLCKPYPPLH